MRVAINCRSFLKKQNTGIGRYSFQLIRHLSRIDPVNQYTLYSPKWFWDRKRTSPAVPASNFSIQNDPLMRGAQNVLKGIDIYHTPTPEIVTMKGAKIVVTVHDLIHKAYPQGHTPETIRLTEECLQSSLKKADRVICISNSTKADLVKYYSVASDKVKVVYMGVDRGVFYELSPRERQAAQSVVRSKGIDGKYILFIGTIEPRKNLSNLLKALSILKRKVGSIPKLVVIGMKGWMNADLVLLIKDLDLKEDIAFLGFLTDDDLRCFYSLAEVFVFPSFYEGFGFPIIEAFSCGAPVVTANVSSCAEIAGEAALKVSPDSEAEIADALRRVLEDPALSRAFRVKGLARAKDFSFTKTAQETLNIYQQLYR